jgi:serine/threonine-protein kinase
VTPRKVGPYRLLAPLAEGSLGRLFVGEHESLGQRVAVKLLRDELIGDPQARQRLLEQGRAPLELHHPGIVRVHDVGMTDDGAPYIVEELLHAEPLAVRLPRLGPAPVPALIEVAEQLAAALASAAEAGRPHADLCARHVLFVSTDGESLHPSQWEERPEVRLIDFGVTMPLGPFRRRLGGQGDPACLAPELLDGAAPDEQSDLYALGCLLFSLGCGRLPFDEIDDAALLEAQRSSAPPAPRSLRPDLPPRLERLLLRLLAKRPAQRLPSMAALLVEVEALRW